MDNNIIPRIEIEQGLDFIGDIHACYEEMIQLLTNLGYEPDQDDLYHHPKGRKIVSLGDVMSRGPYSIRTLIFIKKHVDQGQAYMIDSNHGWKIARWLGGRKVQLRHGDELIEEEFRDYQENYGQEATNQLKRELGDFLLQAPSHIIFTKDNKNEIVVVHGGIKDKYIGKDSKTIRGFCRYGDVGGFTENGKPIRKEWYLEHHSPELIIWGHDPKPEPLIVNHTINIDQGVVFGGNLTAYRYPENQFVYIKAKKDYSGVKDNPIRV